ncbi:chaplin family protein [Homoserinimonas sp. A447]
MHKAVSRALWGAFFVGGLTVLGAGAANAADTSGENGVASGNQVGILGELPVTIGGNAISILGDSESSDTTMAPSGSDAAATTSTTSGEDAILGGNQVMPEVVAPIVASGNAISVLGDSSTDGTQTSATSEGDTEGAAATTTGDDGIASGNQVAPDVDVPIMVGGNDVAVIRDDSPIDGGILSGGFLDEDILNDGLFEDGLFEDGLLKDGLLDDGLVEVGLFDGLLDDGMIGEPIVRMGFINDGLLATPVVDDGLLSEPTVEGPVVRAIALDAFAPVEVDSAVDNEGTVTDAGTDIAMSGFTPLMATAALTPAMMLAATGVETLPLIGGIALMLGTGLALVAAKRTGYAIG